ncbi:hypothetical protein B0H66DRAFT_581072 [Apodospora peruviana]|uniref:FAD-binding domain-containing protein n=1 Tax=Apodospora peruviana TaxID=516989 RepID=A0AAE0IK89_9PEZI|nr:hypothetical protein B0H66DRAFT_581072 [Apodospora peruviana]
MGATSTKTPDEKPTVAIVGAGLTGLLTAHGLTQKGFNVVLFEREASLNARPRDWTIVIHWAMPMFLDLLPEEIRKNVPKGVCNPHLDSDELAESITAYSGDNGEKLFNNPMPGARRVSRQKLRGVMVEGLDIRWGKRLIGIDDDDAEEKVKIRFEDGETFEVDYVLGTDGPASKLRELLFPGDEAAARVRGSGFMIATCITKAGQCSRTVEIANMYVPDPEDKSTWTSWWVKIFAGTAAELPVKNQGQEALDYLKKTTPTLAEPFRSYIHSTPDGSLCYIDEMKYWASLPFDNRRGRVTLAGDAAHPMLVYRGQGFQHAVLDARNYVDALVKIRDEGEDREKVIAAYDVEMVERGHKAVNESVREAELSMRAESISSMLMARKGHGRPNMGLTDGAASPKGKSKSPTLPPPIASKSPSPLPQATTTSGGPGSPAGSPDAAAAAEESVGIEAATEHDLDDENEFDLSDGFDTNSASGSTSATSSIYAHTVEHGRRYQHFKNGRYPIPNDDAELNREDMKHAMLLEITDGELYYAPIGDNPQQILDIGTGTGIWAIDIGDRFPSARVRGIDISPVQPAWVPPNVDFLVDDCENDWLSRDVDFAHFRFMITVLKNKPLVLQNAFTALKPGGWIELQELSGEPLCDDGTMPDNDPVKYVYDLTETGFAKFGMNIKIPKILGPMLEEAGFTNIKCIVKKVPIGVWAKDKTQRLIGMYQKIAVLDFLPVMAGRPFDAAGLSPVEAQVTVAHARKALEDTSVHRYFNYYFWYAQKPTSGT